MIKMYLLYAREDLKVGWGTDRFSIENEASVGRVENWLGNQLIMEYKAVKLTGKPSSPL